MTALVLNNVSNLQETSSAQSTINANNAATVTAVQGSVPITGTTMAGSVDMNSNRILNLPAPASLAEPVRLQDIQNLTPSSGSGSITVSGGTGILVSGVNSYTVSMATTAVVSGSYGSTTQIPVITVNAEGQLTAATSVAPTVNAANITSGSTLSATSDTNVTLSVASGSGALISGAAVTAGWTGTLASSRLNSNVVQTVTSGNNIAASITSQALTVGFTGNLPVANLNSGSNAGSGTFWRGDGVWASASGSVGGGTAGQLVYYATTGSAITGNPNVTNSGGTLTLGQSGTASGALILSGVNAGAVTLSLAKGSATSTLTIPNGPGTLLTTAGSILSTTVGNPPSSTATTPVMCGVGSTFTFTPAYSPRIKVTVYGQGTISATGVFGLVKLYYGTGSAPSAGSATTGTLILNGIPFYSPIANGNVPWCISGIISGLTTGTAYWFDLAQQSPATSSTIALVNLSCSINEV